MASKIPDEIKRRFILSDNATTRQEKGRILEQLICFILSQIPGVLFIETNQLNAFHEEEVDVSAYNQKLENGLPFLPNVLIVECKNWSAPVGAREIRDFTRRLQQRGCDHGIFVAANGITGGTELLAAQAELRSALQDGYKILVVTRQELERVGEASDFIELLIRKILRLTVGARSH
ncbi:MAG: restriction endonuclease [Candidatus Obscuribacterales bacterium]